MTFRVALGLLLLLAPAPAIAQDFAGTWRFRTLSALPDRGLTCADGSVTFTAAGTVTAASQRDCAATPGPATPLGGGFVRPGVSGTLVARIGSLIVQGNVLPGGRAFLGALSTEEQAPFGFGLFVKATTAPYDVTDLAGTWHVRLLDGGLPPAPAVEQAAGTIEISATGNVTGGTLTVLGATVTAARPIIGGTATIDADGVVTGTVLALDGASTTTSTFSGLMTPDKALLGVTFHTTDGRATESGLALLQRSSLAARAPENVAGQWMIAWLLVDPRDSALAGAGAGLLDIDADGGATGTLVDPLGVLTSVSGRASLAGNGSVSLALDVLDAPSVLTLDGIISPDGAHATGTVRTLDASDPTTVYGLGLMSMVRHEVAASTVQFAQDAYRVREGGGAATVIVSRTGPLDQPATVTYWSGQVTGMTPGVDVQPVAGVLTFPAGVGAVPITVPVANNRTLDGDRQLFVSLLLTVGARLGTPAVTTITLEDDERAGTFRLDRSAYTVAESAASVAIVVRRAGTSLAGNDTVRYTTADDTATSSGPAPDYVATSGTLTFGPGETARTITVPLRKDDRVDGDRTFSLQLIGTPGGGTLGTPSSALVTIKDVDAGGVVRLASGTYAVAESAGSVTLTVLRTGGAAGGVLVDFTTLDGTATGGVEGGGDFERTSGTLTFGPGATSATITIPIRQDALAEGPEAFRVELGNARGGATLGTPAAATVTILDDEPTVQLESASQSVLESAGAAVVTVLRSGPLTGTVTVGYAVASGTAIAGRDFSPASGVLTFPPNVSRRTVRVPILDNTRLDGDRTAQVTLAAPIGAQLGPPRVATLTIRDDEQAGTFRLDRTTYTVREGAGSLPVTILRAGTHLAGNVSVTLVTSDGLGPAGARAGQDYEATNVVVTFAAGETSRTVRIPITVDAHVEGDETFGVALAAPTVGATLGTPASAVVTIADESSVLEFSGRFCSTAACTGKGNSPEVVRTGSLAGTVSAHYRAVSGTAILGEDFRLAPGVIVFPPGVRTRLLPLSIVADSIAEGGETFRLELFDPGPNAQLGERATLEATIADDDFGGIVQFGAASQSATASAVQNGTDVPVTIVRSGGLGTSLTVRWSVVGGTLTPTPSSGLVTFGPRDQSVRFTVSVTNLYAVERTAVLDLSFPEGAARLGAQATTTIVVPGGPVPAAIVQLDRAAYSIDEGGTAMLTVTRTGNASGSVTVDFVTTPGTATPDDDYAPVSGTLTLGDGVTSATIAVPTLADTRDDTPQTFGVALGHPSANATLGALASAVVTITAPLPPAAPYSLAAIAFAGGNASFSGFSGVPAINDAGAVAFAGTLRGQDPALWIGTGGGPTLRAVASSPAGGSFPHDRFPIDGGGHVVFDAMEASGESALYSVYDGQDPSLVLATGALVRAFGPPALSATGVLAVKTALTGGRTEISAGPLGGELAVLAASPGSTFLALGDRPAVAGSTVAFLADPTAGSGTTLYAATLGGATPSVRALVTPDRFRFDGRLSVNTAGRVAFTGVPAGGGAAGVLVADADGSVTTIVSAGGAFDAFGAEGEDATPQINDAGRVAFLAFLHAGGHAIFAGPDPRRDRVIGTGDTLDGARVSAVELGGFNVAGQVVFRAWLDDGRQVIAIATPPPAQADLAISQRVDVATPAPDSTVTFTLTATNRGPGTVPDVLVQDLLPSGYDLLSSSASQGTTLLFMGRFVIWSVGSLAAGGPNSTATLTIRAVARTAGDHTNTATIGSATIPDPDPTNDSATATVTPLP